MKKHNVHRLPVTVPQCLEHLISFELQEALKVDGHGIAFKKDNHIKVMYWLDGKDLGKVLKVPSDKEFDKTIKKAIAFQRELRQLFDEVQPQKDQLPGLYIPEDIAKQLPESLVNKLSLDGHGLSFLPHNAIQQRFVRDKIDHGQSYKISDYNSHEELLLAAIKNAESLRKRFPDPKDTPDPEKGVYLLFRKKVGVKKTSFEAYYSVNYRTNCHKIGTKNFYAGSYINDISEIPKSRLTHTYKTAKYFRALYCEQLDESVFWGISAEVWKTKKFYKEFAMPRTKPQSDSTINNSDTSNIQTQPTFEQGLKHLQSFSL